MHAEIIFPQTVKRGFLSKSTHERLFVVFFINRKVWPVTLNVHARPWSIYDYKGILSLQFVGHPTFCHMFKNCLRKLQKRRRLCQKLDTEIIQDCSCKASEAFKAGTSVKKKVETLGINAFVTSASSGLPPEKRIILDNNYSVSSSPTDHNSLALSSILVKTSSS